MVVVVVGSDRLSGKLYREGRSTVFVSRRFEDNSEFVSVVTLVIVCSGLK